MNTYSLYSDGNSFPRAKKSGFGGYIEDSSGQILIEYTEQVKQPEYFHNFELLGIIRGLQLAKSMDITSIRSFCDDKTTALRLKKIFEDPQRNMDFIPDYAKPELFEKIIELGNSFSDIGFEYIPRSQNKHSDALSRRYSGLMEKNFLRQYHSDLDYAQNVFVKNTKPTKRIFFSHPSMVRSEHKINPFLVAQYRNRKMRRSAKKEQEEQYQYLFLEVMQNDELNQYSYKAFSYNKLGQQTLIKEKTLDSENFHQINNFCSFASEALNEISKTTKKVWVYTNSNSLNQYFEQKEKIPNKDWQGFQKVYQSLNNFERTYYQSLPFEHQFSPEIALQEKKKASLGYSLESVDELIEQLQNGGLEKDRKKYFGLLIRHQLRDYRNLLERDLNEIEKNDIIQRTTKHLNETNLDVVTIRKSMGM